jgi:S-adenosylmethionine hydrolase
MKLSPIVLTTDFGYTDEYVGVVKGVILSINPEARVIDLTHAIPPQDIGRAAAVLGANYHYFPGGSVHLCIVDPGVGTARRIIAGQGDGYRFIGPDNGVFSPLLQNRSSIEVYQVSNRAWFLDVPSSTFHGRDIMAPVAARISAGEPICRAGPRLDPASCVILSRHAPLSSSGSIVGEIVSIDNFGNLITNIDRKHVEELSAAYDALKVQLKTAILSMHRCSYGDLPDTAPAAIINSHDVLEICVKNSSAAEALQADIGETVRVVSGGTQ